MSEQEVTFTERAIAFLLSHVNVARLAGGVYLWALKRGREWCDLEIKRLEGQAPTSPSVKVSVTPAPGPTDRQMWEGRA